MRRRTVITGLSLGIYPLTGCLNRNTIGSKADNTTKEGDAQLRHSAQSHGVTANLTIIDAQAPEPDESVSANFKCSKSSVIVTGWFTPPNSCYAVVFKSFRYNQNRRVIEIILSSKWSQPKPPEEVNCDGGGYKYQITLLSESDIPKEIQVVHQHSHEKSTYSHTISNKEC